MRAKILVIAAALLLCFAVSAFAEGPQGEEAKKELQKLQGTWVMVAGEWDGKKVADEDAAKSRITYEGNKITVVTPHQNKEPIVAELVKIDTTKSPKEMHFVRKNGPSAGKTSSRSMPLTATTCTTSRSIRPAPPLQEVGGQREERPYQALLETSEVGTGLKLTPAVLSSGGAIRDVRGCALPRFRRMGIGNSSADGADACPHVCGDNILCSLTCWAVLDSHPIGSPTESVTYVSSAD